MTARRLQAVVALATLLALCLPTLTLAELWRAPIHSLVQVQIDKSLRDPFLDAENAAERPPEEIFESLPLDIANRLGPYAVDYDSFVTTYLSEEEARTLVEAAASEHLVATVPAPPGRWLAVLETGVISAVHDAHRLLVRSRERTAARTR